MHNLSTKYKKEYLNYNKIKVLVNRKVNLRKHFCATKMVKHWNRLPREVVDALHLWVFKRHLYNVLINVLQLLVSPEVIRKLDSLIFEGSF